MANLYDYVKKYGNVTFDKKKFNDIDNLIFSQLAYLELSCTCINDGNYTLETVGREYLDKVKYTDLKNIDIPEKEAYKLLLEIVDKKRYKDLEVSNYKYLIDDNKQFGAITFKISNDLNYIAFEGTNEYVSGWKEDGELACFFPIPSHTEAINYVNDNIKLIGPNIILGGHSKGGNLALIAGMFMKSYKKHKVIKVYSNDGPGLREQEFYSKKFNDIKKKYVHIIPDSSIVGILLRNDENIVVESSKKSILSHMLTTWQINDDELVETELSELSKKFESSMTSWLDKYTDKDRIDIISNLFQVFEDSDIITFDDVAKPKNIVKLVSNLRRIDKHTKDLIMDLFVYNIKNTTTGFIKESLDL